MIPPRPPPEDTPGLRPDVLDWFIRRQRDGWSARDEAAFQAWLAADARHGQAWAQWQVHWRALDEIPADIVARLRRGLQHDPVPQAAAPSPPRLPRRHFLRPALRMATVATVVVASAGAGLLAWEHWRARQPVFARSFRTRRGQQMGTALPDGSKLQLDTATRLQVAYYRERREITLLDGQAVFSIRADAARPLDVLAGPVGVSVVGTRFSVRYTPELPDNPGVQVAVAQGRVRVVRRGGAAGGALADLPGAVYLDAGQQLRADAAGRLAAATAVPGEGIAPWRNHRVSFVDAPLAQVLAELERYGSTGLMVRDPAVAALRLSGTFDPRNARTLRRLLPSALPVQLRTADGTTEVLPLP